MAALVLSGIAASEGIAIGRARVIVAGSPEVPEYVLSSEQVPAEIEITDDERAKMDQQKAAMMSAQAAGPMADAANKGAGAVKQLADAQAGGGVDLGALVQEMVKQNGGGMPNAA